MADNLAHPYNRRQVVTIDDLPDDVLLVIFDFYVVKYQGLVLFAFDDYDKKGEIESWQSLVHVCRRWRCLVFGSPRRLNLQVCCTPRKSTRSLDVWPALPLLILGGVPGTSADNAIVELGHSDRISQIQIVLNRQTTRIEDLWTAMEVPFPELEVLYLSFSDMSPGPLLPDSLLGGSAPRLRYLVLYCISFPGLPILLLFATNLVQLRLVNIPLSRYFSPEAMATGLSVLTSLEILQLEFELPRFSPDQESRRPPPPTRSVLPALKKFWFQGVDKYLEDLVSWIDAPRLYRLSTTFFDNIGIATPELNQFISRTPRFGGYDEARLIFHRRQALVRLQSDSKPSSHGMVEVKILCQAPDRQHSFLMQICSLSLRRLLTVENLFIYENIYSPPDWKDIDLELLLPFTAVKNLYLSKKFAPRIAPALQELTGGRSTEVLPALQNILLEKFRPLEPVQEGIAQFISARQLTNHPVTISFWDR